MQKKDKQKVHDEVWTIERIKDFLALTIPKGENADFYLLYNAYKNMRAEDFSLFVKHFLSQKKQINATNVKGETLTDIIKHHKQSAPYIEIIRQHS